MATYTHKNLKNDVEDSAPGFGLAPNLEARFATDDMELEKSGVGYEKVAPNFRVPFGHAHREQEEIYVVVSGGGRYKIEDDILEVRQWDTLRVPPNAMRCFEAGPDGAEIIAFGAPKVANREEEAEMVPGWWSD